MFGGASSFNQDLDNWDVSKVTTMADMFLGATVFNGSLSGRNTASLTGGGLSRSFANTEQFNQSVNHFITENITSLYWTFRSARAFNQDLDNRDTSKVISMQNTFSNAPKFNGSLS
jgi:surface protein